ncbi:hypothetical protein V866_007233 [Kwoniella sp. B9012]
MAKKKKTPITEAPPPTVHSIEPPTEAPDPDRPPSQHHHHDHEHHHHHSHYARSVDSEGNVKETKTEIVEIKQVKEIPADQIDQEEEEKAPSNASKKSNSVKAPTAPPTAKPPSSKPPTVKPPSTKAPTAIPLSTKAPTLKSPSVKEPPPPASPASSHKSARSSHSHHHQPPVIVNVTIPQAAPAPPPAPVIIPQPAPAEVVEQEEVVIEEPVTSTPLVVPTPIKTPTIIPSSPKPSSIKSVKSKAKSIAPAPTVVEEAQEAPLEEEVTEETKVVTTTTTTTTKKRPPSPPKTPKVISTDSPFVENIDEPPPPPKQTKARSVAPPPSAAAAKSIKSKAKTLPPPSPVPTIHSIAATPIPPTPMKLPSLFKSSPGESGGSGKKKSMKIIETTTVEKIIVPVDSDEEVEEVIVEEEVDTAATTVGNATTKGIGGARSNALTATPSRRSGTKAGMRPIPMIDYQALIQSTPPPSVKKTLSSLPPPGTVAGPKTIVTYSAQLDRDSQGNEHLHARMRDHTGVIKGSSPSAIPGSIHSPPPPPAMPAPSVAPQPQGPKTIVTYSAQLDRDSHGNEHLHGRLRDHTGATPAAPTMAAPTTYAQTTYVPAATTYIPAPAPTTVVPPPAPTLPTATPGPVPEGPKTIVTLSAQLDRDSKGNEHLHARMRDHTGVTKGLELDTGEGLPLETEKERKKREKKEKKLAEKLAAKEASKGLEGNPYKPIGGGVPPPKSERYAYPPAPTVIEQAAKERFQNRFNGGGGGVQPPGMGMSMGMGMGAMGPPYPPIQPALYPRPPPLVANRPPMFGPPMMGMGMGMPMGGMGMGMGMPMMGMGMPMGMSMPMATPIPGVVPGQPGMGWYNSLPGRFGRDTLGRDFAGPGGVGSSQPYRPPDPSALPPMPFGLPFIARPGQEGFDQYGRMLPPDLPEGWDGWGRPLVSTNPAPNAPPGGPGGGPLPPRAPAAAQAAGVPPQPTATQTQQLPFSTSYGSSSLAGTGSRSMSSTLSSNGTGRPDQPPCFDRPPAKSDSYFRYDPFQPFSLPCSSLNYPHQLHLPPELVSHDVNEEDWSRFIDDLSKEALTNARHPLHLHARGGRGMGPEPVLSEAVHSLLASWAVAFFSPRGIKIYAASEESNERILPPPIEPPPLKRGYSHADEWSDEEYSSNDEYNFDDLSEDEEERYQRKKDMYLPRIERQWRKDERLIKRRREKRRRLREGELRLSRVVGNWEIHFICSTPTIWQQGARPRGYGEPVIRLRR